MPFLFEKDVLEFPNLFVTLDLGVLSFKLF